MFSEYSHQSGAGRYLCHLCHHISFLEERVAVDCSSFYFHLFDHFTDFTRTCLHPSLADDYTMYREL